MTQHFPGNSVYFLSPLLFQLILVPHWTALSMSSCTPTMDCRLFQRCVLICGGRSTSLRGSWWVLQQVPVLSVGSFCLYQQKVLAWAEGEMKSKSFYIFMHTNHSRNPASASLFELFSGQKGGRNGWHTQISAEQLRIFLYLSKLCGKRRLGITALGFWVPGS